MEKGSDISKSLALALIILTVLISAASTWVLISSSMESEPGFSLNDALIHLNILKKSAYEPVQTDANSGQAKIYVTKSKEAR